MNQDGSYAFGNWDGDEAKSTQKISNDDGEYLRQNPIYLAQLTAKSQRKVSSFVLNKGKNK